jgi:hypothetical protein
VHRRALFDDESGCVRPAWAAVPCDRQPCVCCQLEEREPALASVVCVFVPSTACALCCLDAGTRMHGINFNALGASKAASMLSPVSVVDIPPCARRSLHISPLLVACTSPHCWLHAHLPTSGCMQMACCKAGCHSTCFSCSTTVRIVFICSLKPLPDSATLL